MSSSLDGVFSFDTPQAVIRVLASVRKSDIAPQDKNELRDLILSFTNGGKDPSLRIQIEQKLTRLGVQPVVESKPAAPAIDLDFGSSRSAPAFSVPVEQVPPQPSVPIQQAAPQPALVKKPVVASPDPVISEPEINQKPADQSTVQTEPVAQPTVKSVPTPAPAPTPTPTPTPTPAPTPENSAALVRVREIKSLVNARVGNPVNLVDIDNQVGREYMSALLDSMKKLSAGSADTVAMQRLEDAYAAVELVLSKPVETVTKVTPTPTPTPPVVDSVAAQPTQIPVVKADVTVAATPQAATPQAAPLKPVPEVVLQPAVATPPPAQPQTPAPVPAKSEVSQPPAVEPVVSTPRPAAPAVEDDRWKESAIFSKPAPVKSIAQSAPPLKSLADVPTQDSVTNKNSDPLQTEEVTDGLNQLLSDWILFKKSGLFGTGPKGVDHPLYNSIKTLQIPLLLAGRFEGATQEIKQSITDYMNGWRYEQGIIYEQGEIFDHYLRRVIRHILDLQK